MESSDLFAGNQKLRYLQHCLQRVWRLCGLWAQAFPRLEVVEQANPGFVAPRTVSGYSVLTGSPLGDTTDPRRIYQNMCFPVGARAWPVCRRSCQIPLLG